MNPREFLLQVGDSRSLIFDLDNTIYDENRFLFAVYAEISKNVSNISGHRYADLLQFLTKTYLAEGRRQLFDKFLLKFRLSQEFTVQDIVSFQREPIGVKLRCFRYFSEYINDAKRAFIITNGNSTQQLWKYEALGLHSRDNRITFVCADDHAPKPQPGSYRWLTQTYDMKNPIYLGDSDVDEEFARRCNISFARLIFARDAAGFSVDSTIRVVQ